MSAIEGAGQHRLPLLASSRELTEQQPAIVPTDRSGAVPPVAFNAPEPPRTERMPVIDRPDASTRPDFVRSVEAEADVETRPGPVRPEHDTGWRLRLPDGSTHLLEGETVLGRNPARPDGVRRIQVADCELGVSRAHVLLRLRGGLLTVQDLGSTNGTYLVDEDGRETRLPVGDAVPMPLGWSLDLANVRLELWAPSR